MDICDVGCLAEACVNDCNMEVEYEEKEGEACSSGGLLSKQVVL